jgi:hypothetical protein
VFIAGHLPLCIVLSHRNTTTQINPEQIEAGEDIDNIIKKKRKNQPCLKSNKMIFQSFILENG